MKTTRRNNQFILLLDDATANKLLKLANQNDHAPSKQAFIIIRNYLNESEQMTK